MMVAGAVANAELEFMITVAFFFCGIVGALLVLNGWLTSAQNAMQQIYCAVNYGTGFLMLGLAGVIAVLDKTRDSIIAARKQIDFLEKEAALASARLKLIEQHTRPPHWDPPEMTPAPESAEEFPAT